MKNDERARRVAVTGLGAITPIGNDVASTWRAALAGESGIDFIRAFDASAFPVKIAGEVKDFDPTSVASPKEARKLDRYVLLSLGAAREAMGDAGLNGFDPTRVGIVFGSAIGGFLGVMEQHDVMRERGPDRVSPNFLPNVLVDSASGQLAISLGVRGPNYAVVSACATGSHAIGEAAELIKRGDADAVLAGGAERAVVVCGSGAGVAVAACKVPGIRAACTHDTYSAHQCVEHDDVNVLCLGARVIGPALAREIIAAFLGATFTGEERHVRRLGKINAIEAEFSR